MARKLIVEILGDSTSLERSFNRSTVAAGRFGKNMDTVGGRLDRTAKKFSSFQTAFVGGLAFGAVATGIRSVVNAAAESQQVLGQTSVALEATGRSWAQYGDQIEKVIQQQSRLGFDDEALLRTFQLFVRTTNDVNQALRLNALATDVARARYIDLEQAALLVNKAAIGQSGALRRLGIDVEKGATAQQLLTALTEKYGGAAQAAGNDAATAFQRAQVELENAREEIGKNLLPTVTGLANTLSDTLKLFQDLGRVKIPEVHIPMVFDFSFGGGTLGGLVHKGIFTLPEFVDLTKDVVNNLLDNWRTATSQATADAANEFRKINEDFFGDVISQSLEASKLPKTVPGAPTAGGGLFAVPLQGFGTGLTPRDILGPLIKDLPIRAQQRIADAEFAGKGIREAHVKALKILTDAMEDPRQSAKDRLALTRAATAERDAIERIDDQATAAAEQRADEAQSQREAERDRRAQKRADDARRARERRERIRERERKEAQRAAQLLQARQFRALGLGPEGEQLVPGVANLREQFEQLGKRIEPGQLSSKMRQAFAGVGRLLRGDLGKLTEATRSRIRDFFAEVRGTFEEESARNVIKVNPRTTAINKNAILAGLGLDRDTERTIRARLSGINAAGRKLAPTAGTVGAFGITVTPQPIHVNTTVNLDGQKVARNTTIHQQKGKRSNPAQKRGPLRGV